ncbi:ribbon-helix-helix domain-containing protein [Brevundimonas sp.]|uniref:ribbon-helix-helix domain-containing protein n=1 Tax=Brevundimonas sp. TaxID=1871086 RepID=UPI003D0F4F15
MYYFRLMVDLALTLPEPLVQFIDRQVGPNGFADRQSAIEAVVADWRNKAERLEALVQEGLDALDAGDYEEVHDIEAWLDGLGRD